MANVKDNRSIDYRIIYIASFFTICAILFFMQLLTRKRVEQFVCKPATRVVSFICYICVRCVYYVYNVAVSQEKLFEMSFVRINMRTKLFVQN